ncbi:MAG: hypothetical protein HY365_03960 [Candidatus Aenigmarchaeota archaeon]|nr:hypothetical protein [Candidatus Aenigmarchaeota archaeon]
MKSYRYGTPALILIFLLLSSTPSYAIQANYEKAGVGRIVGDSAQELLDQLKTADLALRHATYYTDEYLPKPAFPGAPAPKPSERLAEMNDTLATYFGSSLRTETRGWTRDDLESGVKDFRANELFIIEAQGGISDNTPEVPLSLFSKLKPSDTAGWKNKFETARPLFLFDSDYAGLYLPKSVDGSNSFVGQLGQDSIIVSPTAISDREFVKSFICYLGWDNLGVNNSIGEIFRDARNAYYWQGTTPSGLSLMSYELYGNPLTDAALVNNKISELMLLKNCKPYIQGDTTKTTTMSSTGLSVLSTGGSYVMENTITITNYTLENEGNFTTISVGGMQQARIMDDVILPEHAGIEEFPLKTLISNVSVVSLENPVELVVNLPAWNGTAPSERDCWFDKRPAGISYSHAFTEDGEMAITHVKPVEIVNCAEGRVKLYQTVKYGIEYEPFSSILIKKIEAPYEALPDSTVTINVTAKNLRTSSVSGTLVVYGNNQSIGSVSVVLSPNEVKTVQVSFTADKTITGYSVSYIEDSEVKTSKKFSVLPSVLDAGISAMDYHAGGLTIPVGISFNNKLSEKMSIEFDISMIDAKGASYKPLHLPLTLLPGKTMKSVKLETADMPAGAYSLMFSVSHPYGNSIATKPIEIVDAEYKTTAGTVSSFSDGSTEKKAATSVTVPKDVIIKNANIELSGYPSAVYNLYPVNITLYVGNLGAVKIYGKLIGKEAHLDKFTNRKTEETVSSAEESQVTRYIRLMKNSDVKIAAIGVGESLLPSGVSGDVMTSEALPEGEKQSAPLITDDSLNNTLISTAQVGPTSSMAASEVSVADSCSLSGYQQCSNNGDGLTLAIDQYDQNGFRWDWLDDNVKCTDPYLLVGEKYKMKYTFFDDYSGNAKVTYGGQELWSGDPPKSGSQSAHSYEDPLDSGDKTNKYYWQGLRIDHENGAWVGYDSYYLNWVCSDPETTYLHVIECAKDSECSDDKSCNKVGGYGNANQWKCDTPSCSDLKCVEWKEQKNSYGNHACNSVCELKPGRCETPGQELDETHYCDGGHNIKSGVKKIAKVNGAQVWKGFGIKPEGVDILSKVKEFLAGCAADSEGYCDVPVQFTSDFADWELKINSIAAKYIPTIEIGDAIQSHLNTCNENPCQIPISSISYESGTLTFLNPIIQYESYNYKPVVDLNDNVVVNEGDAANLNLRVLDIGNEAVSVQVSAPFNDSDVWQTDYGSAGEYTVTIKASNSAYTVQKSASISVNDVNRHPKLEFVDDIQGTERDNITLEIGASDPDGDELTYAVSDPRFIGGNAISDGFDRAEIAPWIAKRNDDKGKAVIENGELSVSNGGDDYNTATLHFPEASADFNFSVRFKKTPGTVGLMGTNIIIGNSETGKHFSVHAFTDTIYHIMEDIQATDDTVNTWGTFINGKQVAKFDHTYNESVWHTVGMVKAGSTYSVLLDNEIIWAGTGDDIGAINYISLGTKSAVSYNYKADIHFDDMQLRFTAKPAVAALMADEHSTFVWQTQEGDAGNYSVNVMVSDGKDVASQDIIVTVNAAPSLPSEHWGNVTVNDSLALNGTSIEAYINDTLYASMDGGALDGFYDVIIPADDPDTAEKDGGRANDTVVIKIGGKVAKPFLVWAAGINRTDIRVNTPPSIKTAENMTVNETDLVAVVPEITDADNDPIYVIYSFPLNATGVWQTDYASAGEYDVNVTATDGIENTTRTVHIIVKNVNRAPVISDVGDITTKENETVQITPNATDPDEGGITFIFSPPLSNTGFWQPTFEDAGIYQLSVTASDGELNASSQFNITVMNANRPPALTIDSIVVNETQMIAVTPSTSDPDNENNATNDDNVLAVSFSPPLNATGVWQTDYDSAGNYSVNATVSDGEYSVTEVFIITVLNTNRKPVITSYHPADTPSIEEGMDQEFNVSATDADGDALSYSWLLDGTEQAKTSEWTYSAGYTDSGMHNVILTVSDGFLTVQQHWNISVTNVNQAPVIEVLVPANGSAFDEASAINISVSASDPDGDALSYRIEVDGKSVSFTGLYQWVPGNEDAGLHAIKAVVSDGTLESSKENTVIINDAIKLFSMPLAEGWNLVSIPLRLESTQVNDTLTSIDGNYSDVFVFVGNEWIAYDPEKPAFLGVLGNINETLGFWIRMKANSTMKVHGRLLNTSIPLSEGWNLVGYPSLMPTETKDALASISGKYDSVFAYAANESRAQKWQTYTKEKPDFLNSLKFMLPGRGYWIGATANTVWTPGQSAAQAADSQISAASIKAPQLLPPSEHWGMAKVNGSLAPDNTLVEAYIDGTLYAAMKGGTISGFYDIFVPADNPFTPEKEGGKENDNVIIKINGNEATPALKWASGIYRADVRVNMAPIIGDVRDMTVKENETLKFRVDMTDDDSNVALKAGGLPAGAVFDGTTFSWTPNFEQSGNYVIYFVADDGKSSGSMNVTITVLNVNRAPEAQIDLLPPGAIIGEGENKMLRATARDPDGDELIFEWRYAGELVSTASSYIFYPNVTAGDDGGVHVFMLKVSDRYITVERTARIIVENTRQCAAYTIETAACGSDVGTCKHGTKKRICGGYYTWGEWSECIGEIAPVPEKCETPADDDCDGSVNEGCQFYGVDAQIMEDNETQYKRVI